MINKPILGITMGDPAGIGPEIAVKALNNKDIYTKCKPIIIGDAGIMQKAVSLVNLTNMQIYPIKDIKDAKSEYGFIDVYELANVDINQLKYGELSAMAGNAAFEYVKEVINLALNKKIDATVTNPLNKEALNLAGHNYSGHTEIYADLTNTTDYSMMLADDDLRVVHVSTHVSLREACDRVKKERVYKVIGLANEACISLGIEKPKISVAGLNPHAGENGLFGNEEIEEIIPAIKQAALEGILVEGPLPADSLFSKARGGMYDIVVAMYHDQGHIPLKVLGFNYDKASQKWTAINGVNITLGLPIIRSSVDHGTAFDQAGKGVANESSLINAIDYAIKLAKNKTAAI